MASQGSPATYAQYTGGRDHAADLIAILATEWNAEIIGKLAQGCEATLRAAGVTRLVRLTVPGAFELPQTAAHLMSQAKFDAVICLGCIVKGETEHDRYLAQSVASGLQNLGIMARRPVIFGVLTVNDLDQAHARAGGPHGHKGIEAAVAALNLIDLWKTSADTVKAAAETDGSAGTPGRIGFGR